MAVGLAGASVAGRATADCIIVHERAPSYMPRIAVHFGPESDVPGAVQCATAIDPGAATFCVPIYAYNLRDGATDFEFAVRLPSAPLEFIADPAFDEVTLTVSAGTQGVVAGLRLVSSVLACGPRRLGCLLLATADLPGDFQIFVDTHPETARRAVRDARGTWHSLVVESGGARVGEGAACPRGPCSDETPVTELVAEHGGEAGALDLRWRSGSGHFTLLCARNDGRYPNDPWDGQFIALLPADIQEYTHRFSNSGTVYLAAWSVTRGPFGSLLATSTMECGALVSARVDLPVGISQRSWGQVKTLFR